MPFRISSLAVNKTSKLILKPIYNKTSPNADAELKKVRDEYFNVKNLEQEIKRLVAENAEYKFIKVVIPRDSKD